MPFELKEKPTKEVKKLHDDIIGQLNNDKKIKCEGIVKVSFLSLSSTRTTEQGDVPDDGSVLIYLRYGCHQDVHISSNTILFDGSNNIVKHTLPEYFRSTPTTTTTTINNNDNVADLLSMINFLKSENAMLRLQLEQFKMAPLNCSNCKHCR